eukprot:2498226-Pyramimonas_sp.AAC.1
MKIAEASADALLVSFVGDERPPEHGGIARSGQKHEAREDHDHAVALAGAPVLEPAEPAAVVDQPGQAVAIAL